MTLKGSCRTAQGASPGKKHASSHLGNHPRSDPERVEQQRPRREPWRHGRPGCQPGKAEAACTALSGRTSGPATVPRACALGCPAGPLRGPFQFPDPVCFLTAGKTIHPQCQVCPAASAERGKPALPSTSESGSLSGSVSIPCRSRRQCCGSRPTSNSMPNEILIATPIPIPRGMFRCIERVFPVQLNGGTAENFRVARAEGCGFGLQLTLVPEDHFAYIGSH